MIWTQHDKRTYLSGDYEVSRYMPCQWWAYHKGQGLVINMATAREAQIFCEEHAAKMAK